MWDNDKICSNVYKDQQTIEGNVMTAAIYDAPCIFFMNKSFVFTDILLRMMAALLTLQLFLDKNSHWGNFSLAQTQFELYAYKWAWTNPASSILLT